MNTGWALARLKQHTTSMDIHVGHTLPPPTNKPRGTPWSTPGKQTRLSPLGTKLKPTQIHNLSNTRASPVSLRQRGRKHDWNV